MTAGELKWSEDPTIRGAHIAVLWGDPQTGAHGVLKMLPAGAGLATHIHSHDQRAVGITGTVTLAVEGGPAKDMGPGSFAFIPAGVKHAADCKPGADCTYFEEQPGPADLKFVEAASGRD
jgi:quercetin dioxygenase-like cupin family protein